ncbi:hypothetical protein EIP86_001693 [Pleurotus ostreatoroseus]|nr:hypothetical protein EIP86_001693 [Pleurotus ostreatoroseus]
MRVLLTSTAFRALLTDLIGLAKDVVGDTAVKVEHAAETVQNIAQVVQDTARTVETASRSTTPEETSGPSLTIPATGISASNDGQSPTSGSWDIASSEDLERMKTTLVRRLQEAVIFDKAIHQAQADPASRRALSTILMLLRKYASKLESASSLLSDTQLPNLTPIVWADPALADCLSDLKILLSRMASRRPMEPLIQALYMVVCDLFQLPLEIASDSRPTRKVREFLADLGDWFDSSLSDARYATSPEGRLELEELYDRARALVDEASRQQAPWIQHLRLLVNESDAFVTTLTNDATTSRLVGALSALSSSFSAMTLTAVISAPNALDNAQRKVRADLRRDLLRWFLPRIIRALRVIPMPRLEYTSTRPNLDAAIDALYLTPSSAQASLVPDHIRVCNYSEMQLDVLEADNIADNPPLVPSLQSNGMRTCTRLQVYVNGIRLSARDIGYYVSWRAFRSEWLSWLGYEDQGLVSLDIGGRGVHGDGLNLDFELEYIADSDADAGGLLEDFDSLFRVRHVHATIRGLQVSLDKSKHWILNKIFLQPLAGPIGSLVAGWVLRRQLQSLLESIGRIGVQTKKEAETIAEDEEKDVEPTDYAAALWRVLVGQADILEDDSGGEDTDETPLMDTYTRVTAKGIVRQSATYAVEEDAGSPVDESALAVGVGAQILPGKGGPYGEEAEPVAGEDYGPRDMAREVLDEVQSRLDEVMEAGHEAVHHGVEIRRDAEIANEREQQREGEERKRRGWRSRAFDL